MRIVPDILLKKKKKRKILSEKKGKTRTEGPEDRVIKFAYRLFINMFDSS